MIKNKSVATRLNAYFKERGEKMPNILKYTLYNLNLIDKDYSDLVKMANEDPKPGEGGNIDGEPDETEVIKFIMDPNNAYILGKFGFSEDIILPSVVSVSGKPILKDKDFARLIYR